MPRYEQNQDGTWDAIEQYSTKRRPASPRELQFIEAELIRSARYQAAQVARDRKIATWPRWLRWLAKAWYPEPPLHED